MNTQIISLLTIFTISIMSIICSSVSAKNLIFKDSDSSTTKIVKKENFVSPFANYEAFIEFMKGSPSATPSWTNLSLRKSFPQSLYETCFNSEKVQVQEVLYNSPNGYTRGWTLRPHVADHSLPIVVFNRGGFAKWGRIVPFELLSLCQVASNRYMVIASDFRGKQDTNFVGKIDKTDLGYGDVYDNYYFIDAIKKEYSDLDTDNIAVWGFSRGTTLAALMATRSDNIRLIIMQGMVVDLVNNARRAEFDEHVYPLLVSDYSQLSKVKSDKLLNGISPIRLIDQIKGKPSFLIMHGAKDKRAPASKALIYASELVKKNYDVEFHMYPESGHVLSGSFNLYINEIENSLRENLLIKYN